MGSSVKDARNEVAKQLSTNFDSSTSPLLRNSKRNGEEMVGKLGNRKSKRIKKDNKVPKCSLGSLSVHDSGTNGSSTDSSETCDKKQNIDFVHPNDLSNLVVKDQIKVNNNGGKLMIINPSEFSDENEYTDHAFAPKTPGNISNVGTQSQLHKAILEGQLPKVKRGLTSHKNLLNSPEEHGYTPLMSAAALKDEVKAYEMCALLVDGGADVESKDEEGFTPLHWAAAVGNKKVIEFLLDHKANIRATSKNGDTALHRASRLGRIECIEVLLLNCKDLYKCRNRDFKTALEVAGDLNLSDKLAQKIKANVLQKVFELVPSEKTLILHHDDCKGHLTTKGHQEAPERIDAILERLESAIPNNWLQVSDDFPKAKVEILRYAHSSEYLNFCLNLHHQVKELGSPVAFTPRVQKAVKKVSVLKDESGCDTFFSKGSYTAAIRAAGAVCHAVKKVVTGENRNAFCVVRPPGHHAGVKGLLNNASSCGFCIFNNIAVGAAYAIHHFPEHVKKVAIIDFDVHHGNGTEEVLRDRLKDANKYFFFSIHLFDNPPNEAYEFYPGSGKDDFMVDNIVNVPVQPLWKKIRQSMRGMKLSPKGSPSASPRNQERPKFGKRCYREQIQQRLIPALRAYNPDLILISAGFDAGNNDVGCSKCHNGQVATGADLMPADYEWMTEQILRVAQVCCEGRVVSVLEGGYGRWARMRNEEGKKVLALKRDNLANNAAGHVKAMVGIDNMSMQNSSKSNGKKS